MTNTFVADRSDTGLKSVKVNQMKNNFKQKVSSVKNSITLQKLSFHIKT